MTSIDPKCALFFIIALSIEFCFCLCRGAGRKEGSLIYEDEGNVRNVCAPPCCLRDDSIARGAEFSAQCICGGQCKAVASSLHGGKRCCGAGRCKRAGIPHECAGSYSLERNGEKQEIRLATLSDAVRAQYGVDSAYASYATVNLYGNDAAKIDALWTARAIL